MSAVDYADTFWKLWSLLTNFKRTIKQKKVFGCVYTSNSNNLKVWKPLYLRKIRCSRSRWQRWHRIFDLCDRISSQKRKSSRNLMTLSLLSVGHNGHSAHKLSHTTNVNNIYLLVYDSCLNCALIGQAGWAAAAARAHVSIHNSWSGPPVLVSHYQTKYETGNSFEVVLIIDRTLVTYTLLKAAVLKSTVNQWNYFSGRCNCHSVLDSFITYLPDIVVD